MNIITNGAMNFEGAVNFVVDKLHSGSKQFNVITKFGNMYIEVFNTFDKGDILENCVTTLTKYTPIDNASYDVYASIAYRKHQDRCLTEYQASYILSALLISNIGNRNPMSFEAKQLSSIYCIQHNMLEDIVNAVINRDYNSIFINDNLKRSAKKNLATVLANRVDTDYDYFKRYYDDYSSTITFYQDLDPFWIMVLKLILDKNTNMINALDVQYNFDQINSIDINIDIIDIIRYIITEHRTANKN